MTASSSAMAGPEPGLERPPRRTVCRRRGYLRAEVGALDAQLDACGTLQLGVPAAAEGLTLPSSLGARHAAVGRVLPASDDTRRMCTLGSNEQKLF